MKLPISVIVASCNEGYILESCLKQLHFCNEILLFDLDSSDNTKEIAKKYATQYFLHKRVPIVEKIYTEAVAIAQNDWLLLIDPDEVLDEKLIGVLIALFKHPISDNIGAFQFLIKFYFKRKALKGTVWGGSKKYKPFLFHKDRVLLSEYVHESRKTLPSFISVELSTQKNACVHHFWIQSYKQLFKKHYRYLKHEGESMHNNDVRYSISTHLWLTLKAFPYSFLKRRGYKDGFLGFGLSVFWAWYTFMRYLSLLRYELKRKNN